MLWRHACRVRACTRHGCLYRLFIDDFDLLVEHSAGEAIDRHVHPIVLFTFHDEVVLKAASIWLEATCLGNHVNYEVPSARLCDGRHYACYNFPSTLYSLVIICSRGKDGGGQSCTRY